MSEQPQKISFESFPAIGKSRQESVELFITDVLNKVETIASEHRHGLLGFFVPASKWRVLTGEQRFLPFELPTGETPIPDAHNAHIVKAWDSAKKRYNDQQNSLRAVKEALLKALDLVSRHLMVDADSETYFTRDAPWMLARLLESYGGLTSADLDIVTASLDTPYIHVNADSLGDFIHAQQTAHRKLAKHNQPISEQMKFSRFKGAVNRNNQQLLQSFWPVFLATNPTVDNQTFLQCSNAMLVHVTNLTTTATSGSSGFTAASAAHNHSAEDFNALVNAEVDRRLAATSTHRPGTAAAATAGTPRGSAAKQPFVVKYCFTHGYCGHTGEKCTLKENHKGHEEDTDPSKGGSTKDSRETRRK
jgi:hypothetical protein